jgi:hypothetical protein
MPSYRRPYSQSPWGAPGTGNASITVGTEAANKINVAVTLQGFTREAVSARHLVDAYFSSDSAGATPLQPHLMPNGGYAVGTDGTVIVTAPAPTVVITDGNLAISATAEKFKTTQTITAIVNGQTVTKAATDNLTFSAAHVITASKAGVILVQMTAAGVFSTKVPGSPQAYADANAARAALPTADADNVAVGWIEIVNNTGDWTANTDDLTAASDITSVAFRDAPENLKYPPFFKVMPTAAGLFDLDLTETLARAPMYLNIVNADGSITTSGAITFA